MEVLTKNVKMAHVIANQDPQLCTAEVYKFIEQKNNVSLNWNTTPVIVGGAQNGKVVQAQTVIITSCLVFWDYTEVEAEKYLQEQRAKAGIIKM